MSKLLTKELTLLFSLRDRKCVIVIFGTDVQSPDFCFQEVSRAATEKSKQKLWLFSGWQFFLILKTCFETTILTFQATEAPRMERRTSYRMTIRNKIGNHFKRPGTLFDSQTNHKGGKLLGCSTTTATTTTTTATMTTTASWRLFKIHSDSKTFDAK